MKISGLGTHVKVADIKKSRKFYESLGFKAVFGYGDEEWRTSLPKEIASAPEKYRGVVFTVGENAKLEIAEGHIGIKHQNVFKETIKNEKVSAMINVESLLPLFSNQHIKLKFPVRHYYWGTLEAAVRDPDGFVLVFIAPYSETEFSQISKFTNIEIIKP